MLLLRGKKRVCRRPSVHDSPIPRPLAAWVGRARKRCSGFYRQGGDGADLISRAFKCSRANA
jgi:hypothetical protein